MSEERDCEWSWCVTCGESQASLGPLLLPPWAPNILYIGSAIGSLVDSEHDHCWKIDEYDMRSDGSSSTAVKISI